MNRRHFAVAAVSSFIALTACDTDQKPSHTATLFNNAAVQRALQSLESAISGLEGDVGSFSTEDWREVVPGVETSANDVRDAFDELKKALQTPDS
jgi:hypothetical protein